MEKKSLQYTKYALGEIFLVVIGILIALGINNINDKRKTKDSVLKNLERIENEIRGNQAQIEKVYGYHIMVKDTINKIEIPREYSEIEQKLGFWRGHQIFRLQDAAFQTTIQSGITQDINAELLEKLNKLYTDQTFYNDLSKTVTQGLYTLDFESFEGMRKIKNLISMTMVDVYFLETELLESYKACLTEIEKLKSN
ncbi:MAG: hypothetical protein HRU26_01675 [Psychroserpens sp.]|nr:hypothetical protein [Psychroserpens sp.]